MESPVIFPSSRELSTYWYPLRMRTLMGKCTFITLNPIYVCFMVWQLVLESGYGSDSSLRRHGSILSLTSAASLSIASSSSHKVSKFLYLIVVVPSSQEWIDLTKVNPYSAHGTAPVSLSPGSNGVQRDLESCSRVRWSRKLGVFSWQVAWILLGKIHINKGAASVLVFDIACWQEGGLVCCATLRAKSLSTGMARSSVTLNRDGGVSASTVSS